MKFQIQSRDNNSRARNGKLTTNHGEIETPVFMPVGTAGSVKAVHHAEIKDEIKAEIILGNTYHLFLRPGTEIIKSAGGIHKFIGWDMPILTDSGGYQIFSLADRSKITEDGTIFQSHIDGSKYKFTPENVVDIQREIGADIILRIFDAILSGKILNERLLIAVEFFDRSLDEKVDIEYYLPFLQYFFPQ